jgi:DMSO reductase anchor subunit
MLPHWHNRKTWCRFWIIIIIVGSILGILANIEPFVPEDPQRRQRQFMCDITTMTQLTGMKSNIHFTRTSRNESFERGLEVDPILVAA